MIGCLRTRVRKQPIIALYFESENELKFYNLEAMSSGNSMSSPILIVLDLVNEWKVEDVCSSHFLFMVAIVL